ncbi:hypothetical protein Pse7367_3596 [Thalassoporum mexicanum PCC 7367]|uniref:hypothetical protein n=1 Tax=Thalassoporum mexicanum TaxID=3457544 RepID=UPI00029FB735|nr:hypothetical protein [Pseudanabaena sp. PCC 7367]AFY71830.1 hypothetical protein Pse7367_3596 [Pseudanabaena sp. PCC 7367]
MFNFLLKIASDRPNSNFVMLQPSSFCSFRLYLSQLCQRFRCLTIASLAFVFLLLGLLPINLFVPDVLAAPAIASIVSTADVEVETTPKLQGLSAGYVWQEATPASKLDYCERAFAAFRSSPAQSYVISSNVQSLSPAGLCDRIDQFFSLEDNLETRLGEAAAIAPLLYADTPLGTMYNLAKESED